MASRSLNQVQLIGNLTRDPDMRYTPSGTAVCTFGLATNRQWTTENGEKKEDVEFHRIVSWHKLAEICGKFLKKGRKTYVQGRLQTRTWKGNDGAERTTTEIVIDDMIILDSSHRDGGSSDYQDSKEPDSQDDTKQEEQQIPEEQIDEIEPPSTDKKEQKKKTSAKDEKGTAKVDKHEDVSPDDIPF